jgi:hypothetical protein
VNAIKNNGSPACRARALAWARDPAVWAWAVVGLLALLPLRAALA